jgi:uncharacterized protein (DUF4415 family)
MNAKRKWPEFVTRDLGDSATDEAEYVRRWEIYDREMKELIEAGGVHQDADGWWVDNATGKLIGPDPDIERLPTQADLARAKPFREVFPDLAKSIDREIARRGRPPLDNPKEAVTLRLDPSTIARFKASGSDWRARMAEIIEKAS